MRFEYEISEDEYVASQVLYQRLAKGQKWLLSPILWTLSGAGLVALAIQEQDLHWTPLLLAVLGLWWMYAGLTNFFPRRHLVRHYRRLDIAGKKYMATLDDQGFEVSGDLYLWRVKWSGVLGKGESKHTFILYAANTIFMFGK